MYESRWPKLTPCRKPPERVYLRFGMWDSFSYNHHTGERERGVSVYPAILESGVVTLDWDHTSVRWSDFASLDGRCVWAVTGKEVCAGSDSEPVLQGVVGRPFAIAPEVYEIVRQDLADAA